RDLGQASKTNRGKLRRHLGGGAEALASKAFGAYLTALRKPAEESGFGDKQLPLDVIMRDRFVCGIKNEAIQQRLLAEHDLTLEVAYDMTLMAEATAKQQRDIRKQARDGTKGSEGLIQATRMKLDTTADTLKKKESTSVDSTLFGEYPGCRKPHSLSRVTVTLQRRE
ncbi:hypothetical protein HPB47_001320, partial [Ixodes persulcatus]